MAHRLNGSSQGPSWSSEIAYTLGRLEARVEHIADRVESLEQRPEPPPSLSIRDIAPYIWGALILLAAATGRISWGQALGLLGSGG